MANDNDVVPVLFRKGYGDIITAVFPTCAADQHGDLMACFSHIGQHSACSKEWYFGTKPATPAEHADLKKELEGAPYGYRLKVVKRITYAMDKERRREQAA